MKSDKTKTTISDQEKNSITFILLLKAHKIKKPQKEFKFLQDRRFRFDFAWPEEKLAVEIEGGVWTGGRHTRGKGYISDMEKYNLATLNGWKLLRYTPDQIMKIEIYDQIKLCLEI
jgi:very-short-patch-repair endonuclease